MEKKRTTRNAKLADLIAAISAARRILITGHVRPDGDSLGCMIALSHLLTRAGHTAVATADRSALGGPGFLSGVKRLIPPEAVARKRFDLLISLDCGSFDRLPESIQPLARTLPVINIDHHRTNTRFGTWNWIEDHVSSTAELVWRLARKAGWPLDSVAAEALWVALITDSGRFAYDQTTPATLRCGADLLRYGVRTAYINDKIYCSFSRTTMELKKRAFRTLTIRNDNTVAAVTLTGKDFEETGGTKADVEDVIEIPRSLIGNRVAIFFYGNEEDSGETRVSVRTREPLDATALVRPFGGGGHSRAAGCTIKEPLAQAKKIFFKAVDDLLAQHPLDEKLNETVES
ncbi:MAG TPA: bifunctional oligoribonuclease/PAP phosphatase NrnA [Kiritimatiellia bacterium]|nr:bifunctional oligoribonuclease/PAP phosphatase NrnA [Kiritimatiellia bacterium]HRU69913.1 bifunctional oligoribonuclease/PAP phosphatase NrnA [Kiritimatiellia bacterium]